MGLGFCGSELDPTGLGACGSELDPTGVWGLWFRIGRYWALGLLPSRV